MKRISLLIVIVLILSLFSGCIISEKNASDKSSETIELIYINNELSKEYKSYDTALDNEIKSYDKSNDIGCLYNICFILKQRENDKVYYDEIVYYYSILMETVINNDRLRKEINQKHRDYFDVYLRTLKKREIRDAYIDFFINIENYVIDVNDRVLIAINFLPVSIEEVDEADSEFFLQLFLEWEVRYCGNAWKQTDMFIYKLIYKFAENLEINDIAEEYKQKFDEVYSELSELK